MLRLAPSSVWLGSLVLLTLPGCLVSFNDYPLGDPQLEPAVTAGRAGAAGSASSLSSAGSSTGGSSAGGSSAGGAPDMPGEPNSLLIDDFEDGDAAILEQQGRSGSWYAANDGRGMQTPPNNAALVPSPLMPARGKSTRGVHTFGGPFSTWGALIGTVFASNDAAGVPYDLSDYRGLRLWVRSGAAGPAAKQVRLNLRTPATVLGEGCTVCSDHFGVEIPLTAKWAQIDVPFSTLKQVGYGQPKLAAVDLTRALGIELLFPPNVTFDLWVDDVELY